MNPMCAAQAGLFAPVWVALFLLTFQPVAANLELASEITEA
jgi:hypothetical protein